MFFAAPSMSSLCCMCLDGMDPWVRRRRSSLQIKLSCGHLLHASCWDGKQDCSLCASESLEGEQIVRHVISVSSGLLLGLCCIVVVLVSASVSVVCGSSTR